MLVMDQVTLDKRVKGEKKLWLRFLAAAEARLVEADLKRRVSSEPFSSAVGDAVVGGLTQNQTRFAVGRLTKGRKSLTSFSTSLTTVPRFVPPSSSQPDPSPTEGGLLQRARPKTHPRPPVLPL